MNFIRKIFEGKNDEFVHKQFTRYGKGSYEYKAIYDLTLGKDSFKMKSSFEFSGELALALASTLKEKVHVTGGIISTKDLKSELGPLVADIKQFAGVKTYLIDTQLNGQEITDLYSRFPTNLILLSFKTNEGELKSKVKSPTSAKPGKGSDEGPKPDFCTFSSSNLSLAKDFAFDVQDPYKKIQAKHTFVITSLSVPKEYENSIELARLNARRKGKIVRTLTIDGKEVVTEKEFEA